MAYDYQELANDVLHAWYGTNPQITYLPRIMPPTDKEMETLMNKAKTGPLRTFHLMISDHTEKDPNGFMHMFDLWQENKNLIRTITLTTRSTLPLKDYKKLIAFALNQTGLWLHDIEEGTVDE